MFKRIKAMPWRFIAPWGLFVLALAGTIVFAVLWQQQRQDAGVEKEVRSVAQRFVLALTNFSADTIESDVEEIKSFAVGDFADEVETYFGDQGIEAIKKAEAVSEGRIESLFVQSATDEESSVFAVVSETVTNSSTSDPQTDTVRLEVSLIRTSAGWKVGDVQVFQSPGTTLPQPLG